MIALRALAEDMALPADTAFNDEDIHNPLFKKAVDAVFELDARGYRLDLSVQDQPYEALLKISQSLHEFGISHRMADEFVEAIETQAVHVGVDFTKKAKPTPMEISLYIMDKEPELSDDQDHYIVSWDGIQKFGGDYHTDTVVEMHIDGTRSTRSNVPKFEDMFKVGGKKYLTVHLKKLKDSGGQTLDEKGAELANFVEAVGPAAAGSAGGGAMKAQIENGTISPAMKELIVTVAETKHVIETAKFEPPSDKNALKIVDLNNKIVAQTHVVASTEVIPSIVAKAVSKVMDQGVAVVQPSKPAIEAAPRQQNAVPIVAMNENTAVKPSVVAQVAANTVIKEAGISASPVADATKPKAPDAGAAEKAAAVTTIKMGDVVASIPAAAEVKPAPAQPAQNTAGQNTQSVKMEKVAAAPVPNNQNSPPVMKPDSGKTQPSVKAAETIVAAAGKQADVKIPAAQAQQGTKVAEARSPTAANPQNPATIGKAPEGQTKAQPSQPVPKADTAQPASSTNTAKSADTAKQQPPSNQSGQPQKSADAAKPAATTNNPPASAASVPKAAEVVKPATTQTTAAPASPKQGEATAKQPTPQPNQPTSPQKAGEAPKVAIQSNAAPHAPKPSDGPNTANPANGTATVRPVDAAPKQPQPTSAQPVQRAVEPPQTTKAADGAKQQPSTSPAIKAAEGIAKQPAAQPGSTPPPLKAPDAPKVVTPISAAKASEGSAKQTVAPQPGPTPLVKPVEAVKVVTPAPTTSVSLKSFESNVRPPASAPAAPPAPVQKAMDAPKTVIPTASGSPATPAPKISDAAPKTPAASPVSSAVKTVEGTPRTTTAPQTLSAGFTPRAAEPAVKAQPPSVPTSVTTKGADLAGRIPAAQPTTPTTPFTKSPEALKTVVAGAPATPPALGAKSEPAFKPQNPPSFTPPVSTRDTFKAPPAPVTTTAPVFTAIKPQQPLSQPAPRPTETFRVPPMGGNTTTAAPPKVQEYRKPETSAPQRSVTAGTATPARAEPSSGALPPRQPVSTTQPAPAPVKHEPKPTPVVGGSRQAPVSPVPKETPKAVSPQPPTRETLPINNKTSYVAPSPNPEKARVPEPTFVVKDRTSFERKLESFDSDATRKLVEESRGKPMTYDQINNTAAQLRPEQRSAFIATVNDTTKTMNAPEVRSERSFDTGFKVGSAYKTERISDVVTPVGSKDRTLFGDERKDAPEQKLKEIFKKECSGCGGGAGCTVCPKTNPNALNLKR